MADFTQMTSLKTKVFLVAGVTIGVLFFGLGAQTFFGRDQGIAKHYTPRCHDRLLPDTNEHVSGEVEYSELFVTCAGFWN